MSLEPRTSADSIRPEAIFDGFTPGRVGRELVFFDSVDSTNKVLRQAAQRGAADGTVVLADEQTAGRGRLNRSWHSPPGVGIYLSVLLRPKEPSRQMHLYTFLAAVAGARAVRHVSGLPVFIHWPNDLMLRGQKLAGILAESRSGRDGATEVVLGIGMNVNHSASDLPPELHGMATSLALSAGRSFSRAQIVRELLRELDRGYALMRSGEVTPILDEWRRLSPSHRGKPVVVAGGSSGSIRGTTRGVDDDGALLVERPDGGTERVSFGEVRRVRGV